ncbi:hypothetical protein [Floridanema evergladense]|uniref:Uncharacterized protein n=1 Tax=Floridaenema evergladense BLCC-F167 TaxID=3153639 RepID=A0ABV4WGI0_9CYAN
MNRKGRKEREEKRKEEEIGEYLLMERSQMLFFRVRSNFDLWMQRNF